MSVTYFDPISSPGGVIVLAYQESPTAIRDKQRTVDGYAIGQHYGYQQTKKLLIKWHPAQTDIESIIAYHETGGYIRNDNKDTEPAIDESVNLFNTTISFTRYAPTKFELNNTSPGTLGYN